MREPPRGDCNARSFAFVEAVVALISNASWPPSAHHAKHISRAQQRAHTAGGCLYFALLLPSFVEAHQIDSSAVEAEVAVYAGASQANWRTLQESRQTARLSVQVEILQRVSKVLSLRNLCRLQSVYTWP